MKSLQAIVVVSLGLVLFSSCARGYGCPYGSIDEKEIKTAPVENAIPADCPASTTYTIATAC